MQAACQKHNIKQRSIKSRLYALCNKVRYEKLKLKPQYIIFWQRNWYQDLNINDSRPCSDLMLHLSASSAEISGM